MQKVVGALSENELALFDVYLGIFRQVVSFVNVAARLRGAARRRSRGSVMRSEQFLEEQSAGWFEIKSSLIGRWGLRFSKEER